MSPDGPTPGPPRWVRDGGALAWRFLAMAGALWVLGLFVRELTVVVAPVAVALLLTGVLDPVVQRVRRPRLPEWVAPLAAVLVVLAAAVGLLALIGVRVADQVPELRDELSSSVADLEERFSIELPAIPGSEDDTSTTDVSPVEAAEVLSVGAEVLFGAFLTLALTFLFLKDGRAMWAWLLGKLTDPVRDEVDEAGRAAWGTVGAYVRGLTVVALFDAAGIAIGLAALGVPLVLTLAALQFIGSYIPTIGAWVAGGVAVVVALGSQGVGTALAVLALVVVVQQIGNDVIEPWVVGHHVGIHPAPVLIAVTAGAVLWGIAGALLFVPLTAAASAAGHVLWERRHTT